MSCPILSNNKISFEIESNWRAIVILKFSGDTQKRVVLQWSSSTPAETIESCDPSIEPGASYPYQHKNTGGATEYATVKVFYNNADCSSAGPGFQPATDNSELLMNCNSPSEPANHIVIGAWSFNCPDGTDTVEITIVLEDEGFIQG